MIRECILAARTRFTNSFTCLNITPRSTFKSQTCDKFSAKVRELSQPTCTNKILVRASYVAAIRLAKLRTFTVYLDQRASIPTGGRPVLCRPHTTCKLSILLVQHGNPSAGKVSYPINRQCLKNTNEHYLLRWEAYSPSKPKYAMKQSQLAS